MKLRIPFPSLRMRKPRISLKVRHRIAVVALLPVIGMLVFAGLFAYSQFRVAQSVERVHRLADRAPALSGLIHELQRERGLAAAFLAADGSSAARKPLEDQYPRTDAAIKALNAAFDGFPFASYGEFFQSDLETLNNQLAELPGTRKAITGLSMMVSGMSEYYTNLVHAASGAIGVMSVISTNPDMGRMISGYVSLLDAKEAMGQERAIGAGGFTLGRFSPSAHQEFIRVGAAADAELAIFEELASEELMDALFELKVSEAALEVQRMRNLAINSGYGNEISGATMSDWFTATTGKMEIVRNLELMVGDKLNALAQTIHADANRNLYLAVGTALAVLIVNILFAFFVARGVTRPLMRLSATMVEISEGNIETTVPDRTKQDEIGGMARTVEFFRSKLVENRELEERQKQAAIQAEEEKRASMLKLAQDFEDSVGKLIAGVGSATEQMKSSATAMTAIADEASQRSATVAEASEQASANVQTVATATEEMSSSVAEISRQVSDSARMAGGAVDQANQTNDKVRGLAEAAQKIGEVVNMISDIAAQTNLLALNATIEASRAGEAGKGFAVVATEVKSLATQTAKATEEIAAQITAIQDETSSAVDAIGAITQAIGEINEVATAIASAVEQQGAATHEIASNVQQAAAGTQDVTSNIGEVSRGAQEAGSAAQQVLQAAGVLNEQTVELQTAVNGFLDTVRAA